MRLILWKLDVPGKKDAGEDEVEGAGREHPLRGLLVCSICSDHSHLTFLFNPQYSCGRLNNGHHQSRSTSSLPEPAEHYLIY